MLPTMIPLIYFQPMKDITAPALRSICFLASAWLVCMHVMRLELDVRRTGGVRGEREARDEQ